MPFYRFSHIFFRNLVNANWLWRSKGGGGGGGGGGGRLGWGLGVEQLRNLKTFRMNNNAGPFLLKTFSSCRCIVGCLPITLTNPLETVENLEHRHKTVKFAQVGLLPAINYIQIFWTAQKRWKNWTALNHSPYFLNIPKRNGANHSVFQPEFPVFKCKW